MKHSYLQHTLRIAMLAIGFLCTSSGFLSAQDDFTIVCGSTTVEIAVSAPAVFTTINGRPSICIPRCASSVGTGCASITVTATRLSGATFGTPGTTPARTAPRWENIGAIDRFNPTNPDANTYTTDIRGSFSTTDWGKGRIRFIYSSTAETCECVAEFDTYQSFTPSDEILDKICMQPGETRNFRIDGKVSRNASAEIGIDGYTWGVDNEDMNNYYSVSSSTAGDGSNIDVTLSNSAPEGYLGTLWVIQGNTCNTHHIEYDLAIDAEFTILGCPDAISVSTDVILDCDPEDLTYTWLLNDVVDVSQSGPGNSNYTPPNLLTALDEVVCIVSPTPGGSCCINRTLTWDYDDCIDFRKAAPNPKKLTVSPNPGHATIDVSVPFEGNAGEIRVRDISDKIVLKTKATAEKNTLNVGRLAKGVYTITYKSGKTIQSTKFIKE